MRKGMFFAATLFLAELFLSASPAFAIDLSKISFNGYVDVEYSTADNAEGNYNSSFHMHHLSFLLDVPITDKLSTYAHVEFDHGTNIGTSSVNKTGAPVGGGDLVVENAFIRYVSSDAVQFRVGRMLTPFGYYNEIHDATPTIISFAVPRAINNMEDRGGTTMFPRWNTGVGMLGTVLLGSSTLDYIMYVGNGENPPGLNDSESDANPNKAFGARVNFQPNERMQIGASVYSGERAFQTTTIAPIQNGPHNTGGLLFALNGEKCSFLSEYAVSQEQGFTESAGYGQLTYRLLKRLSAYYRLEYSNPNQSVSDDAWVEHIAGLNFMPMNISNIVLKFELSDNIRGANNAAVTRDLIYKEARFAVTLFF
ncbi:MAG: hypothetical protein HY098_05305 [Nitrospinae bacterium]|nr:hypothetical protein [Nitrospinota bacterium]